MLKNQSHDLRLGERAKRFCRLARQFEKAGEYEAACEALAELWPDRGESPLVEGLEGATKAEVLLRVGALAGWMGSVDQTGGGQEIAKNLITRSIEVFEGCGLPDQVTEAQGELGLCYWREGSYDEARIHLAKALDNLEDKNVELKTILLIRAGIVEVSAQRLNEGLRLYCQAAPLIELSDDDALKGSFHNEFAVLFRKLSEGDKSFLDRALIEYSAASFHFEKAGHRRYQAVVDLNLGCLFLTLEKFADAHQHLGRAETLFDEIDDHVHLAQISETRARTFLAEGNLRAAERSARSAVKTFERGGEQALLAEALTTHGLVWARLGNYLRAKSLLDRASEVAETSGDLEGAGRARLSMIEELADQISSTELAAIYESAADMLHGSQDPSASKRLISCAHRVIDVLERTQNYEDNYAQDQPWEGFSFKEEILKNERALIERALKDAGGAVTMAARLLGFKHHQTLISLINSRHKELLNTRSAVRPRRRQTLSRSRKKKGKFGGAGPERDAPQSCILHVESNQQTAKLVDEMFPNEDWLVELCVDGESALKKLSRDHRYDLLVIDRDLPGLSGLDLVQRARKITHRRRTPIIMISGSDCETEAWRAGVDAFLSTPEQIGELPLTISRLLKG
jgi:CheY-like chemotaxis protein